MCFLCRGTHITRDICSNTHETRIFLGRVPKHISLSITRDQCFLGSETQINHQRYVFPVQGNTKSHITRDLCFLGSRTHITRNKCFLCRGTHITRYLCFLCRRTCTTRDVCLWAGEHISLGICVSWVRETHFTLDMCSLCFLVGEQISLGIYVSCVGEHISLGISVPLPMKHISLGIIMCPRQGKTYHWGYVFPEQVNTYQQVNRCAFLSYFENMSVV